MMATRFAVTVLAFLFTVAAVGCGGGDAGQRSDAVSPGAKDALEDFKQLLESAKASGHKPPANKREFANYEVTNPAAANGLLRDLIVYNWGTGLTGGQAVVAYEASADTGGGWVLLQDGTIKQMTAEQFKAAPKAGKK